MASSQLHISDTLSLSVDAITEATAILATRGRGKTHTATVVAEEVLRQHVQVVIMDPVGVYWGLRSSKNGKGDGYKILILGGEHGDLPLAVSDAATIAGFVVEEGASVILDLSAFTKGEQVRFCETFFERLWHLKAKHPGVMLLILEEAQEFAPQRPREKEAVMLGRIERIAKLGRNRGIGLLFITQRPASLNKDVLDLAGILIVLGMVAPIERKVVREWIGQHADGTMDVVDTLPSLPKGTAWLWWPERGIPPTKLQIRDRDTFDSSATPKATTLRLPRMQGVHWTEIDLDSYKEKLGGLIQRAAEDDPRQLRARLLTQGARIAELERQLAAKPQVEVREVERIVDVVPDDIRGLLTFFAEFAQDVTSLTASATVLLERSRESLDRAAGLAQTTGRSGEHSTVSRKVDGMGERTRTSPRQAPLSTLPTATVSVTRPHDSDNGALSGPQQRILDSLAWLVGIGIFPASRAQVAFISRMKPTAGHFNNLLGSLRTRGLIDYPANGMVELTSEGHQAARHPDGVLTEAALQERILSVLKGPQRKIIEAVIPLGSEGITRQALAKAVNMNHEAGHFNNLLGSLRTLGLIEYPQRGWVRPSITLYLEA